MYALSATLVSSAVSYETLSLRVCSWYFPKHFNPHKGNCWYRRRRKGNRHFSHPLRLVSTKANGFFVFNSGLWYLRYYTHNCVRRLHSVGFVYASLSRPNLKRPFGSLTGYTLLLQGTIEGAECLPPQTHSCTECFLDFFVNTFYLQENGWIAVCITRWRNLGPGLDPHDPPMEIALMGSLCPYGL